MSAIKQILVWIDLEMSGLDLAKDHILEIAVNLTDFSRQLAPINSNQKENTLHLVINHPKSLLDSMDEWCTQHHGESGLTALVQQSAISMAEAEERVLQFLQSHGLEPRQALLAGNSVHVDRSFLLKDMPRVIQFLHYRIVDVSSVKEICRNWFPEQFKSAPKKRLTHRALDDIQESIDELRFYQANIFK